MTVAAAVLAALCISLIIFHLHNLQDSSRGEPVRAEEARVHAKENCHSRAGSSYYLYFHVPCRDTVVTCQVPPDIWYYLSKGVRVSSMAVSSALLTCHGTRSARPWTSMG